MCLVFVFFFLQQVILCNLQFFCLCVGNFSGLADMLYTLLEEGEQRGEDAENSTNKE